MRWDFALGPTTHKLLAGYEYGRENSGGSCCDGAPVTPLDLADPVYGAPRPGPWADPVFSQHDPVDAVYIQDFVSLGYFRLLAGLRRDDTESTSGFCDLTMPGCPADAFVATLILGVVALLWTVDCFVGAWLTLPARAAARRAPAAWRQRWRIVWLVKAAATPFRLVFDLHRAGGLWLWGLLFVLAWSAVGFNLPQVYRPVMAALFGAPPPAPTPAARDPDVAPRLGWRAAHARAVALMADAARREGFAVRAERLLFYAPDRHVYTYRVFSDRDPGRYGNTRIMLDGDTGRLLTLDLPTGRDEGTTVTTWLDEIHEAGVLRWPLQVALSITGVGLAGLSVTGVWIWWRKRRAGRRTLRVSVATEARARSSASLRGLGKVEAEQTSVARERGEGGE